jgi:hypothetical protein
MTTTTRPHGMRAELRDWWFDDNQLCWRGDVYGDEEGMFNDGQPFDILSREVLEVRRHLDMQVIEMISGDLWFMLDVNELKRPPT